MTGVRVYFVRKSQITPHHRFPIFSKDDGLIINAERDGGRFLKFRPFDLKKNAHLYQKYEITDYSERFRQDHLSEERRLWYVALTRAKHLLYLSCPRAMPEQTGQGPPDFFQEIRDGFADAAEICQFLNVEDDRESEAELPLCESEDEPAFRNILEADDYGKRLMELVSSWQE